MAASDMNASLQTHSKTRSFCALSEMQVGDNSSHVVIPTPTLTFDLVNPKSIGFDVVSTTTTSVREYVFYVFFRFQKNMTFYVFLK